MIDAVKIVVNMFAGEIITGAVVAIITAVLSHMLYKAKLRNEQKFRFKDPIGEAIAKSLLKMREICIDASGIEKYDIEKDLEEGNIVKAFEWGIYPEIMGDGEKLAEFTSKIFNARKNDEHNLSRRSAAHLYYMQNYLIELTSYISSKGLQNNLPEAGCIFIFDIQKWQHSFDRSITRDMNKHATKVYLQRGLLWEKEKRRLHRKLYDKSMLVLLQKDEEELSRKELDIKKAVIEMLDELYLERSDKCLRG